MHPGLPALVRGHLERSLVGDGPVPGVVRISQVGEMWRKPGGRALRFSAVEELAIDRMAFSWSARFPIAGPLAFKVRDGYCAGRASLEVRALGVTVMRQTGRDVVVGEALRYLAELPLVPQALAGNRELEWRELDRHSVEVAGRAGAERVAVTLEFDAAGDIARVACASRPRQVGRSAVPTPWGGEFGDYRTLGGIRLPTQAEVHWDLAEGRYVYWRGTVTSAAAIDRRFGD